MQRKRFEINTEPHVAEIGDDEFKFKPEMIGDELLDAWAEMRATLDESDVADDDRSTEAIKTRAKRSNMAIRSFLMALMTDESAERFNEVELPDRILLDIQRWALEVYGLRPTGSSSDSSEPSSTTTTSASSTTPSAPEGSTS